MNLIPDWRRRWRRLWSIRLAVLSAALSGAELAVPYLNGLLPPRVFAVLAAVTAIGAALARVVAQPNAVVERRRAPRPPPVDSHRTANAIPPGGMPAGRSWRGEAPDGEPLYPTTRPHLRPPKDAP